MEMFFFLNRDISRNAYSFIRLLQLLKIKNKNHYDIKLFRRKKIIANQSTVSNFQYSQFSIDSRKREMIYRFILRSRP